MRSGPARRPPSPSRRPPMQRLIARVPESIPELCLVRLGFVAHRWTALAYARSLARVVDREAEVARRDGAGLLHSERFAFGMRHHGVLQYWRSFEALDAWSHRPPHSEWWRTAVDRMRRKRDFGIYHESYLVPRAQVESIYLDCPAPVGLATFGDPGEPVGPQTNSRGRLGRQAPPGR